MILSNEQLLDLMICCAKLTPFNDGYSVDDLGPTIVTDEVEL